MAGSILKKIDQCRAATVVPVAGEAAEPLGQACRGQQQHRHPQEEAPGVQGAGLSSSGSGSSGSSALSARHGKQVQGIADLRFTKGPLGAQKISCF